MWSEQAGHNRCHLDSLLNSQHEKFIYLLGIYKPYIKNWLLRSALEGKKRALTWRLRESLEDLEYADDICLCVP
jgi:hypothetical protein